MTNSIYESLDGHDPLEWIYLFFVRLGVPRTMSNLKVGYSWMFWESGGGGGMFNPLNTVQEWPNTTNYNSVGVKNYATWEDGMAASKTAILQERYFDIMLQLYKADDVDGLIHAITSSRWGTTVIRLRTMPVPPMEVEMVIQTGRVPSVAGMVPYCIPAIDGQHVECWYGARLNNDVATPNPNLFLWHPKELALSSRITGIGRRVSDPQDPASGGEKRTGIVVSDSTGRVHNGFWK